MGDSGEQCRQWRGDECPSPWVGAGGDVSASVVDDNGQFQNAGSRASWEGVVSAIGQRRSAAWRELLV